MDEPQLNLLELDLATLQELGNGAAFQQVQILLAQAVVDCQNRPGEKRPRKLAIQLELKPRTRKEEYGANDYRIVLDGVALEIQMDLKCPNRKTLEYDCGVTGGGKLVFNPQSPHNHRQMSLPIDEHEAPAVAGAIG